jgi:hypothetical protein
MYPNADFLVTGVLGPNSNAHSINECLNLDYLNKLMKVLIGVFKKI